MIVLSFVIPGLALLLALLVAHGVSSGAVGDHEVVPVIRHGRPACAQRVLSAPLFATATLPS